VPVRLVDERLSTVEAARGMRAAGRDARSARSSIDAAAAAVLLQSALDSERNTGEPAGELLEVRCD
jgi:putative Holliday junction resolvase